jgi:hypothetical protein
MISEFAVAHGPPRVKRVPMPFGIGNSPLDLFITRRGLPYSAFRGGVDAGR